MRDESHRLDATRTQDPTMVASSRKFLWATWFTCLLLTENLSAATTNLPTRYVAPVRLTHILWDQSGTNLNPVLVRQVNDASRFLKSCAAHGYGTAVWVIDALPEQSSDTSIWLTNCLRAFPVPPVVALDFDPTECARQDTRLRLESFLKNAAQVPSENSGPFAGLLVNYAKADNLSCSNRLVFTSTQVATTIEQVRQMLPRMFLWLRVNDEKDTTNNVAEWVRMLGPKVDGLFLHRWHPWVAAGEFGADAVPQPIGALNKPLVRDGFLYLCPSVRRGLETDLSQNYRNRMPSYEEWVAKRFAGYCRYVGEAIPDRIHPNRSYPFLGETPSGR